MHSSSTCVTAMQAVTLRIMQETPEQAFSERLRQYREASGISQAALAKQVGLDPTAITKIEKGNRSIRLDEAVAITDALRRSSLGASYTLMQMITPTRWDARAALENCLDHIAQLDHRADLMRGEREDLLKAAEQWRRQIAEEEADGQAPIPDARIPRSESVPAKSSDNSP